MLVMVLVVARVHVCAHAEVREQPSLEGFLLLPCMQVNLGNKTWVVRLGSKLASEPLLMS